MSNADADSKEAQRLYDSGDYKDAFVVAMRVLINDPFDVTAIFVALTIISRVDVVTMRILFDQWMVKSGFHNLDDTAKIVPNAFDDDGIRYNVCGYLAVIGIRLGHEKFALDVWAHCLTDELQPPVPLSDTIAEYVPSAALYDSHRRHVAALSEFLVFIESHIGDSNQLRIIDAPCGTGLAGDRLRPRAKQLIGLDLSPEMLAHAKLNGFYDILDVGDMVELLPRYKADLILCHNAAYYFLDLEPVVAAAAAALDYDGWFAFTDHPASHGTMSTIGGTARYCHSAELVRTMCAAHGFTEITMKLGGTCGLPSFYCLFRKSS